MTGLGTINTQRVLRGFVVIMAAALMIAGAPATITTDVGRAHHYSRQEISRAISHYAKRYRLAPALLRAVIKAESDFRQHAVSRKGAVGLMQLTPATAARLRVANIHDPIQNIRGGAKQLRRLLNLYHGDLPLALAAYNAGVNRVKGERLPRIRETRAYVRKVLRYYHRFQGKQTALRANNRLPAAATVAGPLGRRDQSAGTR